ncbi:response regulator [Plectonema cf. radiosum LEGE 06105]|uniref:histidine kinase n=1 Tax=Plectonema cf. radiosum LEGE 06105 TaxID=945769 RepID=A0A8J7K585_9CYAN|nr:response regulator [Plectonema radiosum]MBE9215097.1 response regulator [Plectonema cf. radiosum LEGE 06105]
MKILIVEDDQLVAEALSAVLTDKNYAVEVAADGEAGWDLVEAFDYDLIILDITLPKLDGISLCRRIRSNNLLVPIMLVTGCNSSHEKAVGLDAGADDYLVKPFDEEELVARIRALLRRGNVNLPTVLEWGNLRLDPSSCEVDYDTKNLSLTPKEYSLLELFLRNSRRVFSCGMILEHLWSYEDIPSEEAVRTHIKGLRMKLKAAGAAGNFIETVYGIGYRLKPIEEERKTIEQGEKETREQADEEEASSSQVTKAQTLAAIAGVWEKYKGRVSGQVNVLLRAAQALENNQYLTKELHSQAVAEAHTLAGSLGTFGFAKGSKLARHIELLLKENQTLNQTEIGQFNDWVNALMIEINLPSPISITSDNEHQHISEYPLLLVVDPHQEIPEDFIEKATNSRLNVATVNSIFKARKQLYQEHPNLAIIDGSILGENDGLSLLAEFKNRKPSIPVIILSHKSSQELSQITDESREIPLIDNEDNRILQKSACSEQILETALQLIKNLENTQATVLAVDDDPKVLEVLQKLLKYWGITVKTLAEPQKFWQTLEEIQPDLLILDVEMPGFNGIELCNQVRNHSRWSLLPVLFLTVHNEAETVNQVFSVGADDFVSKPIVGPELVTRIVNRLERINLIRRMTKEREKRHEMESERWRTIFNASPVCIKLVDADGTLLGMNPAALAMIEADETAIGQNIYSVISPEYHQAFENLNKSVCGGNKETLEFEIIGLKGSHRLVETHGVPLLNPENGQFMQLAVTRDITTRKQVEAQREQINLLLKAKVQQQASVAQLGQLALLNKDISALMDEAVALVAQSLNIEFCHILELLPSGNVSGTPPLQACADCRSPVILLRAGIGWDEGLVRQALLSFNDCLTSNTLLTKEPVIIEDLRQETRFNSPTLLEEHGIISGVSVPIFGVGSAYGVLGVYSRQKRIFNQDDVYFLQAIANVLSGAIEKQHIETSLRQGKEELENRVAERTVELVEMNERLQLELAERQRAQAQFSGIVEIASDAIISTDSNQRITLFNQGAERIFGYSQKEALGQPLDLLLPEPSAEAHRHHVANFGKSSTPSRKIGERREIYGKRKDGSVFPAEASISTLKLGNKIIYTVYLQDVSNRKQIERMKNEFVSVVSHELRTPLTSIHGSLGMLATGLIQANSEDGKRLVQIATDSTERLVRLISDILDIERIESGKVTMCKQIYQVSELILQAIHITQTLADKAQVKLSVKNSPIQLEVDGDRIIQVLTNLLSNAIRFSSPGDTVWLTAFEQDSEILFTVKDTGCGIPQDKLELIFERFQQVDSSDSRNHEGTGLGLAICRSILEMHGGKIWAESIMEVGSTFYFTLPIHRGNSERPNENEFSL